MKRKPIIKNKDLWSLAYADSKFSLFVRKDGICERPDCPYCHNKTKDELPSLVLQPSHFHGRSRMSVRFIRENVDCFCRGTHFIWENEKSQKKINGEMGEYFKFKLEQLGKQGIKRLQKKADSFKSQREAIKELMEKLNAIT